MSGEQRQLSLGLSPREPYSLRYLVPHTGVSHALSVLETRVREEIESLQAASAETDAGRTVYLYGPEGSGKTHLVQGIKLFAIDGGLPAEKFDVIELDEMLPSEGDTDFYSTAAATIVDRYQRAKREQGLLVLISRKSPEDVTANPHLSSRFLAGDVVKVSYPREDELHPLLVSLSERRNLKLSDSVLAYLTRRLPLHPLSFVNIFAKIDELSLQSGKPASLGIARQVLAD